MPEQPAPSTTTDTPPPVTGTDAASTVNTVAPAAPRPADPGAAPGALEEVDLDELISKAGDRLWKHPVVAGRVGGLAQQQTALRQRQWKAEQAREASAEAEQRLRQMAMDDPVAFSDQYLAEAQKRDADRKLAEMDGNLMRAVGAAFQETPEWKELTPDDLVGLAKALAEAPKDQTVPTWNRLAVDLLATKRAAKRAASQVAAEVKKEVAASRKEWEAERLAETAAPDMTRSRSGLVSDEPDHRADPVKWGQWYERTVLRH